MNVLVMYDRQTDSLWSQLLGEAVEGELKGQELEYLPSWQTTWADWKTRYPNTVALIKGFKSTRDPYDGYYNSNQAGVVGESFQDSRLEIKEFVIGVSLGDDAVAYPFRSLNDEPVVNEIVDGIPILVIFDAENATGVVFERVIESRTLTFQTSDSLTITDVETSTTWDGLTGVALSGELEGMRLKRVKSTQSFWFGWKDFYPETRVYGEVD